MRTKEEIHEKILHKLVPEVLMWMDKRDGLKASAAMNILMGLLWVDEQDQFGMALSHCDPGEIKDVLNDIRRHYENS